MAALFSEEEAQLLVDSINQSIKDLYNGNWVVEILGEYPTVVISLGYRVEEID